MIGQIRGTLLEKPPGLALVEAGGLGYEVEIPYTTFFQLPEAGTEVRLFCHFVVREDAQSLFGFAARGERDLFRQLIRTSGVGPKLALTILSGLDAPQFIQAVETDDVDALVKIPGIGKKTATRLLMEMRDRIKQMAGSSSAPAAQADAAGAVQAPAVRADEEAEAALIALGYRPQEAARAIAAVAEKHMDSETLIRLALKRMVR